MLKGSILFAENYVNKTCIFKSLNEYLVKDLAGNVKYIEFFGEDIGVISSKFILPKIKHLVQTCPNILSFVCETFAVHVILIPPYMTGKMNYPLEMDIFFNPL